MALANKTSLYEIQLLKMNDWDQSVGSGHLQNITKFTEIWEPKPVRCLTE